MKTSLAESRLEHEVKTDFLSGAASAYNLVWRFVRIRR